MRRLVGYNICLNKHIALIPTIQAVRQNFCRLSSQTMMSRCVTGKWLAMADLSLVWLPIKERTLSPKRTSLQYGRYFMGRQASISITFALGQFHGPKYDKYCFYLLALLRATAQQSYCRHAGVRRPSVVRP